MSKMCKLGSSCKTRKGMCIHEKIITGMLAVIIITSLIFRLG